VLNLAARRVLKARPTSASPTEEATDARRASIGLILVQDLQNMTGTVPPVSNAFSPTIPGQRFSMFDGFVHDRPLYTGNCDCTHRRRVDHRLLSTKKAEGSPVEAAPIDALSDFFTFFQQRKPKARP